MTLIQLTLALSKWKTPKKKFKSECLRMDVDRRKTKERREEENEKVSRKYSGEKRRISMEGRDIEEKFGDVRRKLTVEEQRKKETAELLQYRR